MGLRAHPAGSRRSTSPGGCSWRRSSSIPKGRHGSAAGRCSAQTWGLSGTVGWGGGHMVPRTSKPDPKLQTLTLSLDPNGPQNLTFIPTPALIPNRHTAPKRQIPNVDLSTRAPIPTSPEHLVPMPKPSPWATSATTTLCPGVARAALSSSLSLTPCPHPTAFTCLLDEFPSLPLAEGGHLIGPGLL